MDYQEYTSCNLCPRNCMVDRNFIKGFCGETSLVRVGRASLHKWEEPCISGGNGSGTVFFSGCTLRCCYCQNFNLSRGKEGIAVNEKKLCEIFLNLQKQGAYNINLVTAEHFAPHIKIAVECARKSGLSIPVILNSSGFISEKTLELLKGTVDIYLVDFKYMDCETAKKYSFCENYPQTAIKALRKMVEYKPRMIFDDNGMLQSGVIVRHLCLPGHKEDSKAVLKYVYETYGDNIGLSIMSQYTPVGECNKFLNLKRKLSKAEYEEILDFCIEMGVENAYIQEGEAASESFIPEFDGFGVI
ncbi:MAG: 4Fe-4S cluster-binding domain-containing protein [Clostridia bacterium]|nr:4Fe-4S cluster-binding domain-containing protein [Clostridia bacterium]